MLLNLILVLQVMYLDFFVCPDQQGYACMVIDKEHLEDMDLLFFAAEMTFGHEEVQVKVNKPVSIKGCSDFDLQPGVHTLPMCEAMLVLCQI